MNCFRTFLVLAFTSGVAAAESPTAAFKTEGVAFLKKFCLNCHGAVKPKADLSLLKYTDDASVLKDRKKWLQVLDMIRDGDMPPEGKPRPKADESTAFLKLVEGIFEKADGSAKLNPGRVTLRRLNQIGRAHV